MSLLPRPIGHPASSVGNYSSLQKFKSTRSPNILSSLPKYNGVIMKNARFTEGEVHLKYKDYFADICESYREHRMWKFRNTASWTEILKAYELEIKRAEALLKSPITQEDSKIERSQHTQEKQQELPVTKSFHDVAEHMSITIPEMLFNIRFLTFTPDPDASTGSLVHYRLRSKRWLLLAYQLIEDQEDIRDIRWDPLPDMIAHVLAKPRAEFYSCECWDAMEDGIRKALKRFEESWFVSIWTRRAGGPCSRRYATGKYEAREGEREAQREREELIGMMLGNAKRKS